MAKWADYCITHVRYNSEKTHIDQVQLHKDLGDKFDSPENWTRTTVISYLNSGYTFCTMTKGTNGWIQGAKVEKVTINNKDYIKTVRNSIEEDNLGDLPTF